MYYLRINVCEFATDLFKIGYGSFSTQFGTLLERDLFVVSKFH